MEQYHIKFVQKSHHLKPGFVQGPGKPGKSWNFLMAFSRSGKVWKKAYGPGKFWESVKLN